MVDGKPPEHGESSATIKSSLSSAEILLNTIAEASSGVALQYWICFDEIA
jgi:hypothetical protein